MTISDPQKEQQTSINQLSFLPLIRRFEIQISIPFIQLLVQYRSVSQTTVTVWQKSTRKTEKKQQKTIKKFFYSSLIAKYIKLVIIFKMID